MLSKKTTVIHFLLFIFFASNSAYLQAKTSADAKTMRAVVTISNTKTKKPSLCDSQNTAALDNAKPLSCLRSRDLVQNLFQKKSYLLRSAYLRQREKEADANAFHGDVVFYMSVERTGTVLDCKIISSELNSQKLMTELIEYCLIFNHGYSKEVEKTSFKMTVNFTKDKTRVKQVDIVEQRQ